MNNTYTEDYYADIYEQAYQACIAQGDDRRVARAIAKAKETEERRRHRQRRSRAELETARADTAPAPRKVRVVTIRRSYDAVVNI